MTAYNAVHRYQDAIAAATRVLGLESCLDIVWREQAWALLQCGQYDAAAASAKRYLQSNPHDAVALYIQAHALTEAGKYAEALPVAEQWLQCDPIPAAWSRKIQALLGLQRYEEAAAAAETLSLMAPEDPRAASLAAVALAGACDPRALEAARKWVRLDPANGAAKRLLDQLSEHEA